MTEETAFQRLLPEEQSDLNDLLADLNDLESITPDGEDVEGWEMSLTFTEDDVPAMVEEIEAMLD
jgi:hypothetical protein